MTASCSAVGGAEHSVAEGTDCSVAGGTEGFRAEGTKYSAAGDDEYSAAEGTGAEDAEYSVAGVVAHFGKHS